MKTNERKEKVALTNGDYKKVKKGLKKTVARILRHKAKEVLNSLVAGEG